MNKNRLFLIVILLNVSYFTNAQNSKKVFFSNIKKKFNINSIIELKEKPEHINEFPLLVQKRFQLSNYCRYDSVNSFLLIKSYKNLYIKQDNTIDTLLSAIPEIVVFYYNERTNFIILFNNYTLYQGKKESYTLRDLISDSMISFVIIDESLKMKYIVEIVFVKYLRNDINSFFVKSYDINNFQKKIYEGKEFNAEQIIDANLQDFIDIINKIEKIITDIQK